MRGSSRNRAKPYGVGMHSRSEMRDLAEIEVRAVMGVAAATVRNPTVSHRCGRYPNRANTWCQGPAVDFPYFRLCFRALPKPAKSILWPGYAEQNYFPALSGSGADFRSLRVEGQRARCS